jgi:hypothetical protein
MFDIASRYVKARTCPSIDGRKAPAFHCIFKYARKSLASNFYIARRYAEYSSKGRLREDTTFATGNIFISANLYDQNYYACVCGYPIHALKLLACPVKLLPRTVKLHANTVKLPPRTVKLFANVVKTFPRTVKSLANAVKLLPYPVKFLPRTVGNSNNTRKLYLYARNCPEC